jgi:hypothetical protein
MAGSRLGRRPDPLGKALHFVLVGIQRSGTNLLREVLNTNPRVTLLGEVLLADHTLPTSWHYFVRSLGSRSIPPWSESDAIALMDDYFYFLEYEINGNFWYNFDGRPKAAIGLDFKYNELKFISPVFRDLRQPPFLVDYFRLRNVRVLHLVRRNVVQLALSAVVANARQLWHNWENQDSGQYTVNPDQLLHFVRWAVTEREAFRELAGSLEVLECAYEDLLEDISHVEEAGRLSSSSRLLSDLASFLGVTNDFYLPSRLHKAINRPYADVITNFEEIVRVVKASEFAAFADGLL